jgi:mRNA interferase MazF
MRPIHLAMLDKTRPVVVMTRERARGAMSRVSVAPITSTAKGLSVEVPVGAANGLAHGSVVNCDHIQTIAGHRLGRLVGFLTDDQEVALARAVVTAFDIHAEDID